MKTTLLIGLLSLTFSLPVEAQKTTEPEPAPSGPSLHHRMARGQTLAILARDYGVHLEDILSANPGVVPQHISVGTDIVLPPPSAGWARLQPGAGDTLDLVCQKYGVLSAEVLQLNRLPDMTLRPGQEVLVPRAVLPTPIAVVFPSSRPAPTPAPVVPGDSWVSVLLADGSRAWAQRSSLIASSRTPLTPEQMLAIAQRFEGTPYRWGGETPNGVDCSGFIQEVFALAGHRLPRLADEQFAQTVEVTQQDARAGDLVFFTTYLPGPSHVGIFLGDGRFLHASSSRGVTVGTLQDDYFSHRYLGVHRLKDWLQPAVETSANP